MEPATSERVSSVSLRGCVFKALISKGMFLLVGGEMNRKVKKLTEVLSFADAAGPQILVYLFQWFDEEARRSGPKYRQEIRLLMSAASQVLKKLFLEKNHDLSVRGSDQTSLQGGLMPMSSKGGVGGKNKDDIEKLLQAELIEVAQRTDAARILQGLLGAKMRRRVRRGAP